MIGLKAVLFKLVNQSTYEAMHAEAADARSGGGQRDIRVGRGEPASLIFGDGPDWEGEVIPAGGGDPADLQANMQEAREGEWRIQRQTPETDRHPGWGEATDFPEELDADNLPRLVLWLARSSTDELYAGWLDADGIEELPDPLHGWADNLSNRRTISGGRLNSLSDDSIEGQVLDGLRRRPCALLYGPPGTGKTYVMQQLQQHLKEDSIGANVLLDSTDIETPFKRAATAEFPGETKSWWMTFHQGTTYENTMLGLRPQPAASGVKFEPRAGPFLEAIEHARGGNTSVLFIDEINRGNVARILGDFITFMEYDKRLNFDGNRSPQSVPLTFPMLDRSDDDPQLSEDIQFSSSESRPIPLPYFIPYHVYIIATMNSLDRSVAPLDTALARRFARIEMPVDYDLLRNQLDDSSVGTLTEVAVALLQRVNEAIRHDFGSDFQLGHAYLWPPNNLDSGTTPMNWLAEQWDLSILPQLRELYRNRPGPLSDLLLPDDADDNWPYRSEQGHHGEETVRIESHVRHLPEEEQRTVFRQLAGVDATVGEASVEASDSSDEATAEAVTPDST